MPQEIIREETREDGVYEVTYVESTAVKKTAESKLLSIIMTYVDDETIAQDIVDEAAAEKLLV